jgi:sulfur carrier protein ThiS
MNALEVAGIKGEIISPCDFVRVVGVSHPFKGGRIDRRVAAGLSIAEILDAVAAEISLPLIVQVDGEPVPREWRARVRVKAGSVVTFRPLLMGDNPLRTILGLAVAIAALVVAGPAAGLLGLTGIGFTLGSAAISAGVLLAGTVALNALFPTRPQESITQRNLNSVSGAQNQSNPFGPIPVVLGKHRQSPFYAAKPYTEIVGDDQYLRLLFAFGYGPLNLTEHKIGETPLASFDDLETEVHEGYGGDAAPTLYPGQVDEVSLSVELTPLGEWFSRTTSAETDEFSLDFTMPEGIFVIADNGRPAPWSVTAAYRWRLVGSDDWIETRTVGRWFSTSAARMGARVVLPARGQYEIQVRKPTGYGEHQDVKEKIVWTALRSLKNVSPVVFSKPLALVSMRIRATEQLSGVVDTYNAVCESRVKAFNGASWVDDTESQWPADLYRHVLQGAANARPRSDAEIDITNLEEWWVYCEANGFKFNQVRATVSSVWDTLCDIAAAGRAVPTFIDGKWGVIWDRPTDPVVQHFTPRNSWGLTGERAYAQQPHGWRAKFINEENGYSDDERIVYDDGYTKDNATLFEGIEFPGVTDPELIWKHGRFHIAQSRLRPEKITISTGWEHLVCTRGDRVRVTHDVLLIGTASGRVKSVNGQVISFDEAVTIEAGKTYAFSFRIPGDARSILRAVHLFDPDTHAPLPPGAYTRLELNGDLSDIERGTLWGYGETDQDSAVYRVYGIAHQKDLIANLILVDDAPEISEADQGDIPAYTPNVSIPLDPLTVFIQGLSANFRQGVAEPVIDVVWQPVSGDLQTYLAEISYDARTVGNDAALWRAVYEGGDNKFNAVVDRAELRLRVRAITAQRSGGFTAVDVDPPTIVIAPGAVDQDSLKLELQALFQRVKDSIPPELLTMKQDINQLASAFGDQITSIREALGRINIGVGSRYGENKAAAELAMTSATTANSALAAILGEVYAVTETGEAEGLIRFVASSAPDGVAASFSIEVRADTLNAFAVSGLSLDAGVTALGGGSRIRLTADAVMLENPSTGQTSNAMLMSMSDKPPEVPIIGGTLTVDVSNRQVSHHTLLTAPAQIKYPTGAHTGVWWTHAIEQDSVGGHAVTFDPTFITAPYPIVSQIANTTTAIRGEIIPTSVGPRALLTALGGGTTNPAALVFQNMIVELGLHTNLLASVDAGSSASWDSAVSTAYLRDLTGNGRHLERGASPHAPTFNGTIGQLTSAEYFSTDTNDYFDWVSSAEWQSFHKAGARFTLAYIMRVPFVASAMGLPLFDTSVDQSSNVFKRGIWAALSRTVSGQLQLALLNTDDNSGTMAFNQSSTLRSGLTDKFIFVAMSVNAASPTNGLILRLQATNEIYNASYAVTNNNISWLNRPRMFQSGTLATMPDVRLAAAAIWDRALSAAELDQLYTRVAQSSRWPDIT